MQGETSAAALLGRCAERALGADVLHDDVRRERRRRNRPGQHLGRHRRRDAVGVAFGVDRLVPDARDHDPNLARAPVRKFAGFFEPMALDFPFGSSRAAHSTAFVMHRSLLPRSAAGYTGP